MFETSVVRARVQTRSGFSLLSISIVAHSAIVIGAIGMSIASTNFPGVAPNEYSRAPVFVPVRVPPPLGNPNAGRAAAQTAAPARPATLPTQPTAPSTIPDEIAEVPASGASQSSAAGEGIEPGPIGVPWGVKDSIGDLDAPPVPIDMPAATPEERIYESHEVTAPVLISKVDPRYPPSLIRSGMPATVVLRAVIDRNGNLREPQVMTATMPPFEAEVLRVIGQWRYKPATYGGRAVDSYLNLTVSFQVRR